MSDSRLAGPNRSCRCPIIRRHDGQRTMFVCAACRERYPIVAEELPILVSMPSHHLAREAIRLRRDVTWYRQQAFVMALGEQRSPRRAAAQAQMRTAFESTDALGEEILAMIVAQLDLAALLDVASFNQAPG